MVGKPSARPRLAPCTTRPRTLYGRPRSRAAASTSPARRRFRMRVELTIAPSIWIGVTTSTTKPSRLPRALSFSTSPSARRPKWKSGPTTMRRTSQAPRTRSMNSSAESFANASSKRKTTTASAPAFRRSLARSMTSESADAGAPGASAWIGSGPANAARHAPSSARREEGHRREHRGDEPQVVPLEIPSEEEECEQRERVAGEERRDGGPLPEPDEPPHRDGRGDRDLDRGEREVRLPVRDEPECEEDRREAHPRDRVRPRGAARVVAHHVVVESPEVIREEWDEGGEQEERGGPRRHERRDGLAKVARPFRRDQIDRHERQEDEGVKLGRARGRERER